MKLGDQESILHVHACVAHCDKGFTDDDSFRTLLPVQNTVLSRMGPRLDLNVGMVNGLTFVP